jgi:lambda family phage portal protein
MPPGSQIVIKQNLLDRAIAAISPGKAVERMKARATLALVDGFGGGFGGGYTGARQDKTSLRSYFVRSASADTDIVYDLPKLRGRSRDLVRNAPIATGAVGTFVTNTIGSGLSLQCRPDYEFLGMSEEESGTWCDNVEREFRSWAESPDCDVTRTQNFYQLQDLVFRSMFESGDVFSLLPFVATQTSSSPYQLKIQVIEADRVDNPRITAGMQPVNLSPFPFAIEKDGKRIVSGVEVDSLGAPIAYWIANQHPLDFQFATGVVWERYPAFGAKTGRRNVLHILRRLRPGQNRGVPELAPIIESLKQMDRYAEAEINKAVISAMFTAFVTTPEAEGLATGFADEIPENPPLLPNRQSEVALGNGSVVGLGPGETVEFADPKSPNANFGAFSEAFLQQVGVAIGLPYEVLVKHFTSSYSASRAAIIQAWQVFKQRRDFMSSSFCSPVYEAWMEEAVALGRVDAPGFFDDIGIRHAYLGCEWIGDAPSQIDPLKEIQAAQLRVELGVSDLKSETMEMRGKEWDHVQDQRAKEHKARVEADLEAPVTSAVPPKVAKGEGYGTAPKKDDPNIPPTQQPGGPQQEAA